MPVLSLLNAGCHYLSRRITPRLQPPFQALLAPYWPSLVSLLLRYHTPPMAPLTSPSGCGNCSRLAERISELEQRISTLHQIREAELQMDTIIFGPGQLESPSTTDTAAITEPASPLVDDVAATGPAAAVPLPLANSDVTWMRPGTKPRSMSSSTPRETASWSLVPHSGRDTRPPQAPQFSTQLTNSFDILNLRDFPPLAGAPATSPPSTTKSKVQSPPRIPPSDVPVRSFSSVAHRRSTPQFTPAPHRTFHGLSHRSSPSTSKSSPGSTLPSPSPICPPRPLFPPTTLIIGDSITRNLRFFNATTHCFPGATVPVILAKLPGLLRSLPPSVHRIIVHVGCVDASHRQSEITKTHFNKLFQLLNSTGKSTFISGPLSPHRGVGIFSRVLSLHTWLQHACRAHSVGFIDNFNLFWGRPSLLKADGFHPNRLGGRTLAANVQYAVQHATC